VARRAPIDIPRVAVDEIDTAACRGSRAARNAGEDPTSERNSHGHDHCEENDNQCCGFLPVVEPREASNCGLTFLKAHDERGGARDLLLYLGGLLELAFRQ
jgi:hypothetical protein